MHSTYYIYGLVDPDVNVSANAALSERLAAVFYVGKGTGNRMDQHGFEAQKLIEDDLVDELDVERQRKLRRCVEILQSGGKVQTIKLMGGFEREEDAYRAESFAIEAVNAVRAETGRERLTNAVAGHGISTESLETYFDRLHVEDVVTSLDAEYESILVKGTSEDMESGNYVAAPVSEFEGNANIPQDVRDAIAFMQQVDGAPILRRRWDRHQPWSDEEARERGRRYWPIDRARVFSWVRGESNPPKYLMLAIPEAQGRTVVRYVWEIDPSQKWEIYAGGRWGIPLGDAVEDHPYINKSLRVESESGKTVQALLNYSSGIRIARF